MSKLLKRAESNVNLLLDFLICYNNYNNKNNNNKNNKLNFDCLCSEIVLEIFSYSSTEYKD